MMYMDAATGELQGFDLLVGGTTGRTHNAPMTVSDSGARRG
jgi:sulfite reductase beta subunit-like hemoprotein